MGIDEDVRMGRRGPCCDKSERQKGGESAAALSGQAIESPAGIGPVNCG